MVNGFIIVCKKIIYILSRYCNVVVIVIIRCFLFYYNAKVKQTIQMTGIGTVEIALFMKLPLGEKHASPASFKHQQFLPNLREKVTNSTKCSSFDIAFNTLDLQTQV